MEEITVGEAVKSMSVLMANMYYFLTRAIMEDFGDEARESIARGIREFGLDRGRNIAKKVLENGEELTIENLDKYYDMPIAKGWSLHRTYEKDRKHNITDSCTMATVWLERDWADIGHYYCEVDPAIREGYNPHVVYKPVKNILEGDEHCESLTVYE